MLYRSAVDLVEVTSMASRMTERPGARLEGLEAAAGRGPNVIGATGGSGTRVVARIVRRGGLFIGTNLNESEDAMDLGAYSDRWINVFLGGRTLGLASAVHATMVEDLRRTVRAHLGTLDESARAWGWKDPRSILLLPLLADAFPTLRFLHVLRDGRDMAYSSNQNQLATHGRALLGAPQGPSGQPVRSMMLWSRVNTEAATYGERVLGRRYLRIRYEDLCGRPVPLITSILAFFGLAGDAEEIARLEVAAAPSVGRWRTQDAGTLREIHRVGRAALVRFGYEG